MVLKIRYKAKKYLNNNKNQQTNSKKYKDITYRGTYEFDFLENFYDVIKIKNAKIY